MGLDRGGAVSRLVARRAPDPPDHERLEREPEPEQPARYLLHVAPDLLGVDRHVDVGGEDRHEQSDEPPTREAACDRRDYRKATRDLGVAAPDHRLLRLN